ncbi:lipid scramblase CLPTM1L-like [Diadema antillarum]|uniref:lipid scramblase CLPTM1L-like n=1 Tax=Diadema antillarum TaxID=105358 RepID=UPI003A8A362E
MASIGKFFNNVLIVLFLGYLCNVIYTSYQLFNPPQCDIAKEGKSKCLSRYENKKLKSQLQLRVYTSLSSASPPKLKQQDEILHVSRLNTTVETSWTVNVSLPAKTCRNGSLFIHAFLQASGSNKLEPDMASHRTWSLTKYSLPRMETFNLLSEDEAEGTSSGKSEIPVAHWKSKIYLRSVVEPVTFHRMEIPADVYRFLKLSPQNDYLPILYVHKLSEKAKDLQPINESCEKKELTIHYAPFSIGQLRLFSNLEQSTQMMRDLGFHDKDIEEVMGIFTDISLLMLGATLFVSFFHLLFDFLAFKNDISYWQKRNSMVGLAISTVTWRCVSQLIIFLYLMEEDTSLLVLVPCGIGAIIEVWKVKKAFKFSISFEGWKPVVSFGSSSDSERATAELDSTAMKYMSYGLYPLCALGAIYSLIYVPHKSWYSWLIKSLVNGVYAFGFVFMLPQLFVNYKMKSVAHLPWRAFMYKAFNTFIDDVFAFIITMPTMHRLACFRDDVVFLIYLYQRWLYPVDKTRINEYGMSYEENKKEHKD